MSIVVEDPAKRNGLSARAFANAPGKHRVALVTNIPTPYRNPCYWELARRCDLKVFFNALSEPNRDWTFEPRDLEFPHEVVKSILIPYERKRPDLGMRQTVYSQIAVSLPLSLSRYKPNIVIGTAFNATSMMSLAYAKTCGAKFILWSEGTRHTEDKRHPLRIRQRQMMTRWADGFWSNGLQSTQLLEDYGRTPSQPVQEGMTGVSTDRFRRETEALLPRRQELRSKLGLEGTVFLFVGAVSELKGTKQLAAALKTALSTAPHTCSLVVAGRGPLLGHLTDTVTTLKMLKFVSLGFVQTAQLPELFAAADVFVVPTLADCWSLATLEAAAAGLPQVFSSFNGGSEDIMRLGGGGALVVPTSAEQLADIIARFAAHPPRRKEGPVLDKIVDYYSPQSFAKRGAASFDIVSAG